MGAHLAMLLALSVAAPPAFTQSPSPAAKRIDAAQAKITKSPDAAEGYNALALALARRARETADTEYYAKAADALEMSFQLAPDNFGGQKIQIWVLLGQHEFERALEKAKALNRRAPDDVMVYGLLTDAHVELGDYEAAEEAAQWMLDLRPGNLPGITRGAYLRELFGDIDGALEWMRRAYEQTYFNENEERAWLLTQVAHLERSRGAIGAAEEAAENALELFPDYHYALAELAHIRMAQGKSDEAVSLFEARYRMAPHPENLYDLAKAKRRAGRRREAVDLFSEFERLALRESEANDNANRELVFYYADVANDSSAALGIARLASGRRQDVFTLDAYAWALFRSGSAEEAWEQMETALAPGIQDAKFLYHAGCIRAALADSERATRYWERSLRLDPYSEVAAAAKRALDEHGPTAGN